MTNSRLTALLVGTCLGCGGGDGDDGPRSQLLILNSGGGRVSALPAGIQAEIDCGPVCKTDYAFGQLVTLTATPDPGQQFLGWEGACVGVGPCEVAVEEYRVVTAKFGPPGTGWVLARGNAATGRAVVELADGSFVITGEEGENGPGIFRHLYVSNVSGSGEAWSVTAAVGGTPASVSTSADGRIYVAGQYVSSLVVASLGVTGDNDSDNGFLLELTSSGQPLQLLTTRGSGRSGLTASYATSDGVIVGGNFADTVQVGATPLTSIGARDALIATVIGGVWTPVSLGSSGDDELLAVSASASGTTYALVAFGAATTVAGESVSPGMCLITLTESLVPTDVVAFEGAKPQFGWTGGLTIDPSSGDLVIAFTFGGSVEVDASTVPANGNSDWLVARLTALGEARWWSAHGGDGKDYANSVAMGDGRVYVAGGLEGQFVFAATTVYAHSNTSPHDAISIDDGFVATFDAATGTQVWSRRIGGWEEDNLHGIAASDDGVFTVGTFSGGPHAIGVAPPPGLTGPLPVTYGVLLQD